MIKPLDPRLVKIIALMRSTTHEGERASAERRAEAMAEAAGITLRAAEAQIEYERVRAANPNNLFAGFDEYMEITQPGHIASVKAARAEKIRAWAMRKAAIIERYGSQKAAIAPCEREKLLIAAVKPWRKVCKRPWQRWTESLDGWTGSGFEWRKMPAHVLEAIKTAYPLPSTFAEAKAESDYWIARNQELEDVQSEDGRMLGDTALDRVADVRAYLVRDLAERDLLVTTLVDLHARFAMYRAREVDDHEVEAALFRDLTAIVASQEREAA